MKSFYAASSRASAGPEPASSWTARVPASAALHSDTHSHALVAHSLDARSLDTTTSPAARIAIYDRPGAAPRVEEVAGSSTPEFIADVAARVYECARAMGGRVPYSVVREVVENFIHADFRDPVISVLEDGDTIRFSDQGPGFDDSVRALEPGYTTATHEMKQHIRGVGSGLPLVRECLAFSGGSVCIEQNLRRGSVVTLTVPHAGRKTEAEAPEVLVSPSTRDLETPPASTAEFKPQADGGTGAASGEGVWMASSGPSAQKPSATAVSSAREPSLTASSGSAVRLTNRQKQVLALVMETGQAGPSLVAKELSVGLSTAYRDLERLESLGLIVSGEAGKREITDEGAAYLGELLQGLF